MAAHARDGPGRLDVEVTPAAARLGRAGSAVSRTSRFRSTGSGSPGWRRVNPRGWVMISVTRANWLWMIAKWRVTGSRRASGGRSLRRSWT